jgi:hypothetical protein
MNLQDDPGAVFRKAMSDDTPPPARFDLDEIVRDGYRTRNRHRAVLGGAASIGVAAVAAVLALSVTALPGGPEGADDPTEAADPPAAETEVEDPSSAGYPYSDNWGTADDAFGVPRPTPELLEVKEVATETFGNLLAEAGVWSTPENAGVEEDCAWLLEQNGSQEEIDNCMATESGLHLNGLQNPGNYGQTYLRSYQGNEVEEEGTGLRTIFEFELALPGGWTAEPGPITEQVFPQHLISDGPYFTDEAPAFTTEALEDGRTLMVADHGCAADVAVVYPNGTGLRTTWNDCSGTDYPLDLDALTEAALAMPEMDLDTTGLAPVGELAEVPMGWVYDEEAWENTEAVQADARATYEAARAALLELHPEATLSSGAAVSLGQSDRGAMSTHSYSANGTLPIEVTMNGSTGDVYFDMRYHLPGGWLPGYSEQEHRDPHLRTCSAEDECTSTTDDDGTIWTFEQRTTEYEPFEGEDWEAYTDHQLYASRFDPAGWAIVVWINWTDDAPIDAEVIGDILRAMPAPQYDEDAVPTVPAG